jgi:hypothetical protein
MEQSNVMKPTTLLLLALTVAGCAVTPPDESLELTYYYLQY